MNTDKAYDRRLSVPATATLLRRFHEQCPRPEIYDKAIRCYETLLDAVQDPSVSREIAALLHVPPSIVKSDAEEIITLLLFNEENDPYLSFGLNQYAPFQEVNRRRKGLISLYHPDRHLHQELSEDKARKINKVHEEIRGAKERKGVSLRHFSEMVLPENNAVSFFTFLKCVPSLIMVIAVAIALFSLSFFIFDMISANPFMSSTGGKERTLIIIPKDRNKDTTNAFP